MTIALNEPQNLWQQVLDTHQQYTKALNEFLVTPADKVEVLRQALHSKDRLLALQAIHSLSEEERKALLPEWVNLARSVHGPFQVAWNIIQALPRDWMLQHIENCVDAILQAEIEDDYWMFLQLYSRLDLTLQQKLARRAAAHGDPAIRELSEEYLASPPISATQG
jgi:hypothetical protein